MTPNLSWFTDAPGFSAQHGTWTEPDAFKYDAYTAPDPFKAPTAESMLNDPGYQFRADQGRRALENSAAGKGTLRTGGTLKDILGYGQNLASQEYGNVYQRDANTWNMNANAGLQAYGANRANAKDIYDTGRNNALQAFQVNDQNTYQAAKDAYAPSLLSWQQKMGAHQNASNLNFQRMWDAFTYGTPSASTIYTSGL